MVRCNAAYLEMIEAEHRDCLQRRVELRQQGLVVADPIERDRIFATMPSCVPAN